MASLGYQPPGSSTDVRQISDGSFEPLEAGAILRAGGCKGKCPIYNIYIYIYISHRIHGAGIYANMTGVY